jgi:hypothetical protein
MSTNLKVALIAAPVLVFAAIVMAVVIVQVKAAKGEERTASPEGGLPAPANPVAEKALPPGVKYTTEEFKKRFMGASREKVSSELGYPDQHQVVNHIRENWQYHAVAYDPEMNEVRNVTLDIEHEQGDYAIIVTRIFFYSPDLIKKREEEKARQQREDEEQRKGRTR